MYTPSSKDGYRAVLDKIQLKTLVHGDSTLMAEFRLAKGAVLPAHKHPHEQTGYLVSGQMELSINGAPHLVNPGDSWCIGGEVEHHAVALADSVAIEVFSPVREDYLPEA